MDGPYESFEKLDVWRRPHARSIEFYRSLGQGRGWGFRDRITRAANSIADNIAEGAERPGKAEFRQFLGYAKGPAGKGRSQVLRAIALRYITKEAGTVFVAGLRELSRMIHGLVKSLDR